MTEEDKKPKGDISWRQAMMTAGLALSIPFMIGLPAYVGWLADNHFATSPLWFLVGLILGLFSTAIDIYKLLKRFGQFK
ncbi:MAG: AtpZ/AtpI family protein [Acidobacteria bacterium]|nr:AtpZ/AtpI family protein [Acidobacteriota bacterium]